MAALPSGCARRRSARPVRRAAGGRVPHACAEAGAGGRWLAQVIRRHQRPCPHDAGMRDELETRPA
eukprot:9341332-Lingulodinium_polyedra.AAC.1